MIIVSACLLGENCKYSGGNNKSENVIKYLEDKLYFRNKGIERINFEYKLQYNIFI